MLSDKSKISWEASSKRVSAGVSFAGTWQMSPRFLKEAEKIRGEGGAWGSQLSGATVMSSHDPL